MSRTTQVVVIVAGAAVLAGGTATAAKLITGKDVRDKSLTGADVRPGSLGAGALTGKARESLRGQRGEPGERGPSDAYAVRGTGRKQIDSAEKSPLLTVRVPAGDYTVQGKAVLLNATAGDASPNCQVLVSTGGRFRALDQVNDIALGPEGSPGDTAEAVLLGFTEVDATGTFQLRCTPGSGERFNARDRVLIATRVGALR